MENNCVKSKSLLNIDPKLKNSLFNTLPVNIRHNIQKTLKNKTFIIYLKQFINSEFEGKAISSNANLGFKMLRVRHIDLLFEEFRNFSNLKSAVIDLTKNLLVDYEVENIGKCILNFPDLLSLNFMLSLNKFGDNCMNILSDSLKTLKSLTILKLDLKDNFLTDNCSNSMKNMISSLTNLKCLELNLRTNRLSEKTMIDISDALINNNNIFQKLSMNLYDNTIKPIGMTKLASTIESMKQLTYLSIMNDIKCYNSESIMDLAHAIENIPNLTNLKLGFLGCKLEDSLEKFCAILSGLTRLKLLSLEFRNLKFVDNCTDNVAIAISKLTNLNHLSLLYQSCCYTTDSAILLSKSISCLSLLEILKLDFQSCKIQDEGLISIVNSIKLLQNISIVKLNLNRNNITSLGAEKLLEIFSKCNIIPQEISFKLNPSITQSTKDKLLNAYGKYVTF